jgi:hypothetical protein
MWSRVESLLISWLSAGVVLLLLLAAAWLVPDSWIYARFAGDDGALILLYLGRICLTPPITLIALWLMLRGINDLW